MKLVPFLTTDEVLTKALELIASPLPHEWATCRNDLGPYCPRCAAAQATTQLAKDLRYFAGDDALSDAVLEIAIAGDRGLTPLSQEAAEATLEAALTRVLKRDN